MAAPVNFLLSERSLDDRTGLLSAEGETNAAVAARLTQRVTSIIQRGTPVVIVDMSGVSFVDSAVVDALADTAAAAQHGDAQLIVVEPVDPKIAYPLEHSGLKLAAVVVPTLDAAARAAGLPGAMLRPAIPPAPPRPPDPQRPRRTMFGRRTVDQEILKELGQLRRSVQELQRDAGTQAPVEVDGERASGLEAEIAKARAEADRMEDEAELAHARIQALERELTAARAEIERERSEVEMLREDVDAARTETVGAAAQTAHIASITEELERSRAETDRMEDEAEHAHARIQALEGDLTAARSDADRMEDEAERAHAHIQQLEAENAELRASLDRLRPPRAAMPPEPGSVPEPKPIPEPEPQPATPAAVPQPPAATHDLEPPVAPAPAPAGPRPKVPVWADSTPINLNTADLEELMLLPGIGRRPAEKIMEFRTANGGLKAVDDLYAIDEIPNDRINRIRPYVRV
jgi:anti-anti-sigma factor